MMSISHVGSVVTLAVIAVLVFGLASRLGHQNVDHWLTDQERHQLTSIRRSWWLAVVCIALLLGLVQRTTPTDAFAPFVMTTGQAVFLGVFVGLLMAMTRIDMICRLLPDQLTASLLVSGLLFHWIFETGGLIAGVIGATLGYGLLWLLATVFEKLRGQEAMGRGDFFMAAGLGAWLGWYGLPMVLLLASVFAILVAFVLHLLRLRQRDQTQDSSTTTRLLKQEIPFGPALCAGGIATFLLHHG
jgi:prepilin signal peptidase PulO-like enzyme (type II secretory pathway)